MPGDDVRERRRSPFIRRRREMHRERSIRALSAAAVALSATIWTACGHPAQNAPAPGPSAPASDGKIPVTTASEDARKEFLQGRDLAEKLLVQDSLEHFDKAIALDPNFASAELARANASPTPKEFFDHLGKAVSLSGKVSDGERLLILATEAGANGNTSKQKEYLEELVAHYPNDERAHFNLGGYYFAQQDFAEAIQHYKQATTIAPSYSPAYNILGYAYRQNGDFANAEQSFKKYIELIPTDPNPYDSYGELLLKMGKYDDSIVQYRKALSIDPNFAASHLGIAADLMYSGKADEAAAELKAITDKARNDGDRRTALGGMTTLDVDGGKLDRALADVDAQYALGEKTNDVAAMVGDLQTKGAILVEAGKYDEAKAQFDRALDMVRDSSLSQAIKDNAQLVHHFNLATVAIGKKDYATAKSETDEFRKGAEASTNPVQVRQAHELAGRIALAQNDYDTAIAELAQANPQDPYNLYRLALAYQGKGDAAKAKEFATKAAEFNSLPQLNYAFVRTKAKNLAAGQKG
jgi:tetratricopeptide (TPR) repeat protein